MQLFAVYLIAVSAIELIANYKRNVLHVSNLDVYNYFIILEFIFFSYFFLEEVKSFRYKTVLIIGGVFIALFLIVNIYFLQGSERLNTISNAFTSLYLILLLLIFFWELLKRPTHASLFTYYAFWIAFGLLVYKVLDVPLTTALNYLNFKSPQAIIFYQFTLMRIANYIMYSLFIIGIICFYRTRN